MLSIVNSNDKKQSIQNEIKRLFQRWNRMDFHNPVRSGQNPAGLFLKSNWQKSGKIINSYNSFFVKITMRDYCQNMTML